MCESEVQDMTEVSNSEQQYTHYLIPQNEDTQETREPWLPKV